MAFETIIDLISFFQIIYTLCIISRGIRRLLKQNLHYSKLSVFGKNLSWYRKFKEPLDK